MRGLWPLLSFTLNIINFFFVVFVLLFLYKFSSLLSLTFDGFLIFWIFGYDLFSHEACVLLSCFFSWSTLLFHPLTLFLNMFILLFYPLALFLYLLPILLSTSLLINWVLVSACLFLFPEDDFPLWLLVLKVIFSNMDDVDGGGFFFKDIIINLLLSNTICWSVLSCLWNHDVGIINLLNKLVNPFII